MDDEQQYHSVTSGTNPPQHDGEMENCDDTQETKDTEDTMNGKENPEFPERHAKFAIGELVKHRFYAFRGIIFDVDPHFNNTEEWYESIPLEVRPAKDQPFYHLLAESEENHSYVAYVSEQNLVPDTSDLPIGHEEMETFFSGSVETGLSPRISVH